ncbi:MAG: hypothetical protein ACKVS9_09160 [Phycisphaerae bacterium]
MNRLTAITVLSAALGTAAAVGQMQSFEVRSLGAGWTATGLNNFGVACGSMSPDGTKLLAGVARNGQPFELLPLPPGMQSSRVHDINDAGVIVGSVCPNQYVITQPTAAVWRPVGTGYEVEVLGGLAGDLYSVAYAINNLGDIIGASGFWGWNPDHPILYTESGPTPMPYLASDINDERVIVAGSRLVDLDTGVETVIPLPPGNWQGFAAAAINNHNDVCGYIVGYSGCSTFPMRYMQVSGWEYLGGCATTTSATAINDRGDALLYYYTTTSGVHFGDEGYFALGSLIHPSQGEWYVQYGGANGINNSRQIIAAAREGFSGPIGAILMTPMGLQIPGDVDGDRHVDLTDLAQLLAAFGTCAGDAAYLPAADFDDDQCVVLSDLAMLLANFGV